MIFKVGKFWSHSYWAKRCSLYQIVISELSQLFLDFKRVLRSRLYAIATCLLVFLSAAASGRLLL